MSSAPFNLFTCIFCTVGGIFAIESAHLGIAVIDGIMAGVNGVYWYGLTFHAPPKTPIVINGNLSQHP